MNAWLTIFLTVVYKELVLRFVNALHRNRSILQLHRVNRLTTYCKWSLARTRGVLFDFSCAPISFPGLPEPQIDEKHQSRNGGQCGDQVRLEAQFLHRVASIA
jgi:hypothetical protein